MAKTNHKDIINIMGVSTFLSGKTRNITNYKLEQGLVAKKHMGAVNELVEMVENWIEKHSDGNL